MLWDLAPLAVELAVQYAVPVFVALEEQLGEGRVAGVQLWHLRTQPRTSLQQMPAMQRFLAIPVWSPTSPADP